MGLALVAAARGYRLVLRDAGEDVGRQARRARVARAREVVITPNAPPSTPDNFRNVARRLADEHGWFLTDQFRNPANVRVHEDDHRGRDPRADAAARSGAFVAGAGTGGTITGVGRRLKAALPGVRIVLADPVGSALADWVETGRLGPGRRLRGRGHRRQRGRRRTSTAT